MNKAKIISVSSICDTKQYSLEVLKLKNCKKLSLRINQKTKNPKISIPYLLPYKKAVEFFHANETWVQEQLGRYSKTNPSNTIMFLGEAYTLSKEFAFKNKVSICHNTKNINIKYTKEDKINNQITCFLKKQAYLYFYDLSLNKTEKLGVNFKKVIIMDSNKWGSCSTLKNLRYNYRLIMAPPFVLEYLAAHEVAHLREFNHSKNFWNIVTKLTPYTKEATEWLKNNSKSLY